MVQGTGSFTDLAWLLDDLVSRVEEAQHGIVFSTDGLLMAASAGFPPADAEHLAAVGSAIQSLGRGVATGSAAARCARPSSRCGRRSCS